MRVIKRFVKSIARALRLLDDRRPLPVRAELFVRIAERDPEQFM